MLHTDDLTLLNFEIAVVATHMIGPYTIRKTVTPEIILIQTWADWSAKPPSRFSTKPLLMYLLLCRGHRKENFCQV